MDQLTIDHFLKHPRAAASGVLLLPGRLIRRAHHPQPSRGVGEAFAHARAAVHGFGEVVDATHHAHGAQVTVHRARVYQDAGVQQVLWVEGGLHLTKGLKSSG